MALEHVSLVGGDSGGSHFNSGLDSFMVNKNRRVLDSFTGTIGQRGQLEVLSSDWVSLTLAAPAR